MTDYKNSAEGRIVTAKYQDILHLSRPEPSYRHPRMPVAGRAKIFSPFAALRGIRRGNRRGRVEKESGPEKTSVRREVPADFRAPFSGRKGKLSLSSFFSGGHAPF